MADLSDKSESELTRMWAQGEITKEEFNQAIGRSDGDDQADAGDRGSANLSQRARFTKTQANRTGKVSIHAEAPIPAQHAPKQATITVNGDPVRTTRSSPPFGASFTQTADLVGSGDNEIQTNVEADAGDVVAVEVDGEEWISTTLSQSDVEPPAPRDEPKPTPDPGPATPGSTGSGNEVDGDPSTVEDRVEAGLPEQKEDKSSDGPGLDRNAERADRRGAVDTGLDPEDRPENRNDGGESDQGGSEGGSSGSSPTLTARQKKVLAGVLTALAGAKYGGVL